MTSIFASALMGNSVNAGGDGGENLTVWLCKICAEQREIWKKSGAWFFKVRFCSSSSHLKFCIWNFKKNLSRDQEVQFMDAVTQQAISIGEHIRTSKRHKKIFIAGLHSL